MILYLKKLATLISPKLRMKISIDEIIIAGVIRGVVIYLKTPLHPTTNLPASSNFGSIWFKKKIVRSIGIGRYILNNTKEVPKKPNNSSPKTPSLPKSSNHPKAKIYGGIIRGIKRVDIYIFLKEISVLPTIMPKITPKNVENSVTVSESKMLFWKLFIKLDVFINLI